MTAAGVSTSRPRPPLARRAAICSAFAAGLALCAMSPAFAQDGPPVGPSATVGALGAAPTAAADEEAAALLVAAPVPPSAASATPTPSASAGASAPSGGSTTILINDGPPGSTPSGWSPVAAGASASGGPEEAPAPAAADAPVVEERREDPGEAPPGTTIIPSAAQQQAAPPGTGVPGDNPQVVNYEANQQMPLNEPQLHSLQEFMNEGVNASPLGVELEEGARRGKNGREVDGLLVVALEPGGPAERAGVQAGHRAAHDVLEGAAVAASLVFPPAVLAVPVIETIQLGENYDLIIGVDGNRVTNFMDFQDQLREAQPGETVYLNILRSGQRLQVPVEMPPPDAGQLYP